jgi:hypothetical protein
MKFIIATVLALTATTAAANHRLHCGTTQHQYWENQYVRVIETRNCRNELVDWRRIDSSPSYPTHVNPHKNPHGNYNSNNDAAAILFGVILGNIIAQQNR